MVKIQRKVLKAQWMTENYLVIKYSSQINIALKCFLSFWGKFVLWCVLSQHSRKKIFFFCWSRFFLMECMGMCECTKFSNDGCIWPLMECAVEAGAERGTKMLGCTVQKASKRCSWKTAPLPTSRQQALPRNSLVPTSQKPPWALTPWLPRWARLLSFFGRVSLSGVT